MLCPEDRQTLRIFSLVKHPQYSIHKDNLPPYGKGMPLTTLLSPYSCISCAAFTANSNSCIWSMEMANHDFLVLRHRNIKLTETFWSCRECSQQLVATFSLQLRGKKGSGVFQLTNGLSNIKTPKRYEQGIMIIWIKSNWLSGMCNISFWCSSF